jgi:hypothetical protein
LATASRRARSLTPRGEERHRAKRAHHLAEHDLGVPTEDAGGVAQRGADALTKPGHDGIEAGFVAEGARRRIVQSREEIKATKLGMVSWQSNERVSFLGSGATLGRSHARRVPSRQWTPRRTESPVGVSVPRRRGPARRFSEQCAVTTPLAPARGSSLAAGSVQERDIDANRSREQQRRVDYANEYLPNLNPPVAVRS